MSLRRVLPPLLAPPKLEIHLTSAENAICELLNDCSQFLQKEKGISVTCRIAGGWVRDKVNQKLSNNYVEPSNITTLSWTVTGLPKQ